MTQAINLIDGLDGLAAGIVAIGAGAFFLYSQKLSDADLLNPPNLGPLIAIIAVGLCVGFLPHNFSPARIFMGDSGALLLGLLMAVATSVVGGRTDPDQRFVGQTYFFLAPLVLPLFILGVPVLDLTFAIVRRATRRKALDVADKGHLHHRLMNLGHGHRRSVVILWTWTALLSVFVLYPVLSGENPTYLPFGIVALGIVLYTVLHPSVRKHRVLRWSPKRRPRRVASRRDVGVVAVGAVVSSSRAASATAAQATQHSAPPTDTRAAPAPASSGTVGPPGRRRMLTGRPSCPTTVLTSATLASPRA